MWRTSLGLEAGIPTVRKRRRRGARRCTGGEGEGPRLSRPPWAKVEEALLLEGVLAGAVQWALGRWGGGCKEVGRRV